MNLGDAIKNARKKKRISQKELSDVCGISQAYLSQIENNQKEPHLSTLKKIAFNLNIPLPIIFLLSLDENDIDEEKRKAFKIINPIINSMLDGLFSADN